MTFTVERSLLRIFQVLERFLMMEITTKRGDSMLRCSGHERDLLNSRVPAANRDLLI